LLRPRTFFQKGSWNSKNFALSALRQREFFAYHPLKFVWFSLKELFEKSSLRILKNFVNKTARFFRDIFKVERVMNESLALSSFPDCGVQRLAAGRKAISLRLIVRYISKTALASQLAETIFEIYRSALRARPFSLTVNF